MNAPQSTNYLQLTCRIALIAIAISLISLEDLRGMPLSPESVEYLKVSGRFDEVIQQALEARNRGIDAPGSNILPEMRRVRRDDIDEVTLRVLILLVDFQDNVADRNGHSAAHYDQLLFSQDELNPGSMQEWYLENSLGEVRLIGEVRGWYRLPQTYAFYVDNNYGWGNNFPRNSQGMVRDAVNAANNDVDYSLYDNDDDGYLDGLFVVHAGPGAEQNNANRNMIWSHAWALNNNQVRLDNTIINAYNTVPEDGQIGVFGHELGHALFGLPDLYDRDNSSEGLGIWSMMASGSWGDGGRSPAHFDAWSKMRLGFINPRVQETDARGVTILPAEQEDNSVILWTQGSPEQQYFLIENREQIGFDRSLPGPGLLIYHIDDAVNTQNDREWVPGQQGGHYLVALEQADGDWDLELEDGNRGDADDPFPGGARNTVFDANSTPNSNSYTGAQTSVSIRNIRQVGESIVCDLEIGVDGGDAQITLDPTFIEDEIGIGESRNYPLVVGNEGNQQLTYRTVIEILEEPEQNRLRRTERALRSNNDDQAIHLSKATRSNYQSNPRRDLRGGPDDYGYHWIDSREENGPEYEWIDVSGRQDVQRLQFGDDSNSGALDLGFEFPFYGEDFSEIRMCSNGWASFTSDDNIYNNQNFHLPGGNVENMLAVCFSDWYPPAGGSFFYWSDGETAVLTWQNVPHIQNRQAIWSFQIILHQNGEILYQYLRADDFDDQVVVGIQNGARNDGLEVADHESGVLESSLAISIAAFQPSGWISVDPTQGNVEPGGEDQVTVTIDATDCVSGRHVADIHFQSNDPDDEDVITEVVMEVMGAPQPRIEVSPTEYAFGEVLVGSREMWDELSIRNIGEADLHLQQIVSSSDAFTTDFANRSHLLQSDDGMGLRVFFEPSAPGDYQGTLTIFSDAENSPVVEIQVSGIGLQNEIEQSIPLRLGWNLISFHVELEPQDPGEIVSQLVDEGSLIVIKDDRGQFYRPDEGYSNLPDHTRGKGYLLKVDRATSLRVRGLLIDPQTPIQLRQGWQFVAYYPTYPLPVIPAFDSIVENLIIVRNQSGAFYRPDEDFENIGSVLPHSGLQVKLEAGDVLIYPGEDRRLATIETPDPLYSPAHYSTPIPTGESMSLLIKFTGHSLDQGRVSEIAAIGSRGEVVGWSRVMKGINRIGIAVWGDDPTTGVMDGLTTGEEFRIQGWNGVSEFPIQTTGNTSSWKFDPDQILSLNVDAENKREGINSVTITPNPINGSAEISFELLESSDLHVTILDITGRQVHQIAWTSVKPGKQTFHWDPADLRSGVYFCRISTPLESHVTKLTLLR